MGEPKVFKQIFYFAEKGVMDREVSLVLQSFVDVLGDARMRS
jgi:hypothetical protein